MITKFYVYRKPENCFINETHTIPRGYCEFLGFERTSNDKVRPIYNFTYNMFFGEFTEQVTLKDMKENYNIKILEETDDE